MNVRVAVIGVVAILLPFLASAQDMKLPVFFLRYDGGVGSEEIGPEEIEEEQMEPSSQRHKVTLRIKEEWSDEFTTNLYTAGLGLESRLSGAWRLSGRYREIVRVPLGPESTVADRFNHEFGVNVSWDPNQ